MAAILKKRPTSCPCAVILHNNIVHIEVAQEGLPSTFSPHNYLQHLMSGLVLPPKPRLCGRSGI